MNIFRRFRKSISLRLVNLLGLAIMFACLLLSYDYIKKEKSYDRFHEHADRIVRLSLQYEDDPVDGRIVGNDIDPILQQLPEVEQIVKLEKITTGILDYQGKKQVLNDFYLAKSNFFEVFSIPLLHGEKANVLQTPNQAVISASLAQQLFGTDEAVGKEMEIDSRKNPEMQLFVSGVFKDFPENSHFHTDVLVHRPEGYESYRYVYLLLKENTNVAALTDKITERIAQEKWEDGTVKISALLMPMTNIHLHSRMLREMETNGNIYYLYLIFGANILLLVVVLFNLWLNTKLIFSYSRRYYQLLRLNGASTLTVIKDEAWQALLLACASIIAGGALAYAIKENIIEAVSMVEIVSTCAAFMFLVVFVSLLPVVSGISSSLFLNTTDDMKPTRFSYSNVKYMLTAQFAIVVFVVIMAFGISRQMDMVKETQAGGSNPDILVLKEQPWAVQEKYTLLKAELLKNPAITSVTAAMQLPGEAIRDATNVKIAGSNEQIVLPIIVVSEDFMPFFDIPLIAGKDFAPHKLSFREEQQRMTDMHQGQLLDDHFSEEYIINEKAMIALGFEKAEDAVGKVLEIIHPGVGYIDKGVICGVTGDFNYTGLYENTTPLLVLQRRMFMNCIMIKFDPQREQEAVEAFNKTWSEVNPDYPADYTFMKEVFGKIYHNEIKAGKLVALFSLLCFIIADLGLIIFMAFIIKRRRREVGIRKVNGASVGEIVRMLNLNFIRWIALSFVIATPLAWFVLKHWLENFAYRTALHWWIFAVAGFTVLLIALISVSLQSWRAATANPVDSIKDE